MFGIGSTEIVIVLVVVAAMFFGIVRLILGGSRSSREREAREAQITQEIHAGLMRMEQRVEALETLLLDTGKDRNATEQARK